MNWLAHLVLGGDRPVTRLGSLLADSVARRHDGLSEDFLAGVRRHRRVDAYMETHPAARASRARIRSIRGRYAPIAVDFLYDHLLARTWEDRHGASLAAFVAQFERDVLGHADRIPSEARDLAAWIVSSGTLRDYATTEGILLALERYGRRMSDRLGIPVDLRPCIDDLEADTAGFEADFEGFWRDVRAMVAEEFPSGGA